MISNNQVVAKVPTKKYLGIQSIEEFLAGEVAIPWLIDGWIQENCLMMVHGPSASGKTFLVLDWCLRLSAMEMQNRNWCGHKTKSCQVLYLVGEGQKGLRTRIRAWQQHHRVSENDFHVLPKADDLDREEIVTVLAEEVGQLGLRPGIIVVDTLHRYFSGDENSARDAKAMLESCAKLMDRFGCTVILVHHTGLAADAQHRARGSSAWRGALDIEVSVKPPSSTKPISILQKKMKDAEHAQSRFFKLQPVSINGWFRENGQPITSVVLVETERPSKQVSRKPNILDRSKKRLEGCWLADGNRYTKDGKPYVAKLDLVKYLQEQPNGLALSTARRETQPDANRMIGVLMTAQLIKPLDKGWIIVNEEWTSVISLIAKNTDPKDKKKDKRTIEDKSKLSSKKQQKNNNLG